MKLSSIKVLSIVAICLTAATSAKAQVSEIRIGISEFDERTLNLPYSNNRANENSVALNFEIVFNEPDFLKWALSPQPYIGGTLNLEGKTSFGGGGLLWRQTMGEKLYGDFSFGLVAHTGTNNIKLSSPISEEELMTPAGFARLNAFFDRFRSEKQFGSSILFRQQIALGYNLNDDWSGEMFIEHISNGKILSSEENDGANILGFRAVRKF